MGHRFIDHTADVAAELDAPALPELFGAAARALTDTITRLEAVASSVTELVTLEAPALDDLLVDFLNELLYRFEVRALLVSAVDLRVIERDGRWSVTGSVSGEPMDPVRHPTRVLVKGATYHGLHITCANGTWRARVVFDI
jgi:SHS2 domain-containing protein